jgi:hypothetical protein
MKCTICGTELWHEEMIHHNYVWGDIEMKKCDDFPICVHCSFIKLRYNPKSKNTIRHEEKRQRYLQYSKERINEETEYWDKIQKDQNKKPIIIKEKTQGSSCCTVLKSHAELLKDDPERLSTDFIKKMSKCDCKKQVAE